MGRPAKSKVVKENGERWVLTYADLITLLLVFFILLFAMSSTNTRKFEDLTGALKAAFNNGLYQLVVIGGSPGNPKTLSGTVPSEKKDLKQLRSGIAKLMKEYSLKDNIIHVGTSREGIVVTLSGNLWFYPGGTDLRPESYTLLQRIAMLIQNLPNNIRIEGNTDNQVSGSAVYSSNWVLSALRAVSIVTFLSQHGGIAPVRLAAEGLSQFHPAASNATPGGRALNRRADLVILYP